MHEYEYQVPPQALWEWDDGQSMYPPNTDEPMVIYRGADSRFTPPVSETEEEGTLVLTIRTRDDRHVWHQTLTDLTTEIIIPADVTKDMKEGRHYYFYDIMAVGEETIFTVQPLTPVEVHPTAGGVQYNRRG